MWMLCIWSRNAETLSHQNCVVRSSSLRSLRTLSSCPHRCWRASLQELAWRGPDEQHVFHLCDAKEHHVEVEPSRVIGATLALGLIAGAIDGNRSMYGLTLRGCCCQEIGMNGHKTNTFQAVTCPRRLPRENCFHQRHAILTTRHVLFSNMVLEACPRRRLFEIINLQPDFCGQSPWSEEVSWASLGSA